MSETIKQFLYLNRKAPYGTIYAWESLEVVLIGAAFDQDVSLAFVDDGVFQLTKGQDTAAVGMKNFSPTYSALGDYEVKKIYVEKESLEERGLTLDDLQHLESDFFHLGFQIMRSVSSDMTGIIICSTPKKWVMRNS